MRNRRKQHFIDSAVQGALLRRILLHWLVFFAMTALVLPLWQLMSGAEIVGPFSTMLFRSWQDTAPVLVILVVMVPVFVWDTVKFSNRFAGPMYRLHRTIQSLNNGETFQPIRLRKGDFWKDFAADFNAMVERLTHQGRPAESAGDKDEALSATAGDDPNSPRQ